MPKLFLKGQYQAFLLSLVFILIWDVSFSQTYYLENYSVRQGLASSKVYDLLQDEQGYIWLATSTGLSKFDGQNFISFGREKGIDENNAKALLLDSQNRLWIGFENGRVFTQTQDTFQLILSDSINTKGEISDIVERTNGDILISTFGGGLFYITNPLNPKQKVQHLGSQDGIDQAIFKAEVLKDGKVFFATSVDLQVLEKDSLKIDYFRPKGFPLFFLSTCLTDDLDGNIWIGKHNGGLYKYNKKSGQFKFFDKRDGLAHNWVSTVFVDSKNRVWVGTFGGGVSLIINDSIHNTYDENNGLNGINVHKIIEDKEGNIYFATHENGFYIFKGNQFLSLTEDNGLPNQQIWDICEIDDENVLIATNNGVAELHFSSPLDVKVKAIHNQNNNALISNTIRNLAKDKYNNIWIGSALSGIQKYNIKTKKFEYDYVLNSMLPQTVKAIHDLEVVDGELYIATLDGLINHNIKSGKSINITQTKGGLSDNDVSTLYKGLNNRLWIGVRNGGVNYIDKDFTVTYLEKTIPITPICFAENSKGDLWVGTIKGVFKLVNDSLELVLNQKSGLMSNYVSLLHFLDDDRLVVGSNNGLNIYYLSTGEIVHYNKNVGYIGIETKTNSFLDRGNGTLLFGTTGGLMIYNTEAEDRQPTEAFVHITRMRVNMEDQAMIQDASFRYDENSLLFNFHGISLSNQSDLEYQVMVEGLDQTWREPTQSENISLSQLPPGKYKLLVKAITFDGIENQKPASYAFTIRPPFWRTWWFISASLFIIIASTFFGVRYRIYLLKKEKEVLEQKVVDRTKEISQKNEQLAEKNKHITDSINYARRIQYATMRPEEQLYQIYNKAFILYIPKDIVSGDFYWYTKKGKNLIVAAADCTGHGVPGAFMSMLGIAYLNEIVGRMNKFNAADILEKLRANVIGALHQSDAADTAKDGMDIALVILDTETNKVQFSGAYNPLYLLRNKELLEFKGDRMPIGVHARDSERFTNYEEQLVEGDQLYFFTDGYADQFGGPKGKKMNYKRFKNHLQENAHLPLEEQNKALMSVFKEWQGTHEQLDDVLLIGLKV